MANKEKELNPIEEIEVKDEKNKAKRTKFKDLAYEGQLKFLEDKIKETEERIETLKKSLSKAKKDVVNFKNQYKAIMYDNEHSKSAESEEKQD